MQFKFGVHSGIVLAASASPRAIQFSIQFQFNLVWSSCSTVGLQFNFGWNPPPGTPPPPPRPPAPLLRATPLEPWHKTGMEPSQGSLCMVSILLTGCRSRGNNSNSSSNKNNTSNSNNSIGNSSTNSNKSNKIRKQQQEQQQQRQQQQPQSQPQPQQGQGCPKKEPRV